MESISHFRFAALAAFLLPGCALTPAQKQEPTRVANDLASKVLKTMAPGSSTSVLPKYARFPSKRPIPAEVVAQLPARVRSLPQNRVMTVGDVVAALGLEPYRDRVSSNYRWNTYFIFLNEGQIIDLVCDPVSLRQRTASRVVSTRWNTIVSEVRLRKNPDVTVAARPLPVPLP